MGDVVELTKNELAKLRKKYPLPENVPDADLNMSQAAQFMGTTTVTIGKWLEQGLPALERGGNGREYKFRAADIFAWRKARLADEDAQSDKARAAIRAMRLELVGGSLGDSIDALAPKEKLAIIATQREHEAFQRDRNELIKRDDAIDAFETIYGIMRDALDSLPDQIHREAGLSNKQLGHASEICDRTLGEVEGRIKKFFADRPKGKAAPRNLLEIN